MKDQRDVAFLEWFATQKPKRPAPMPGMGGQIPGLPTNMPSQPDIGLTPGLGLDRIGSIPPADPAAVAPASATTTPAEPKSESPPPEAEAKPPESKSPEATPQETKSPEAKSAEPMP